MKKRKHPQTAPTSQLSLLDYQDRVNQIVQDTNSDPDYERLKAIFAQLSKELETL